ncbi:short-chain dehydrogenase/reductase family 42e member [Anaeramoeba flamelloides]|uniref:Short-chain dehydrogenase/reductase family 42e member n=1 Tax=Anaeramoeba flamelloides TaxID=1746091 RepID=A0AAV7YWP4_9EUKA|nr:short-chain dehydrogenase/reductase family 42e member [Anaeramoeba flamelloides]
MNKKETKNKFLVIGGTTYLGHNITRSLVSKGHEVTVLDYRAPIYPVEGAKYEFGDLRKIEILRSLVSGCDGVFHCVTQFFPDKVNYNSTVENILIEGTKLILKVCRQEKVRALVYTSSPQVVVNGKNYKKVKNGDEESCPIPKLSSFIIPRHRIKAEAESLITEANGSNHTERVFEQREIELEKKAKEIERKNQKQQKGKGKGKGKMVQKNSMNEKKKDEELKKKEQENEKEKENEKENEKEKENEMEKEKEKNKIEDKNNEEDVEIIEEKEKEIENENKNILLTGSVRVAKIYGPNERQWLPKLVSTAKAGLMFLYKYPSSTKQDFCYIDNAAHSHCLLMDQLLKGSCGGKSYFVADQISQSSNQFQSEIIRKVGYKPPKFGLPYWVAFLIAVFLELFCHILSKCKLKLKPWITKEELRSNGRTVSFSIDKIINEVGYSHKIKPETGFKRTCDIIKGKIENYTTFEKQMKEREKKKNVQQKKKETQTETKSKRRNKKKNKLSEKQLKKIREKISKLENNKNQKNNQQSKSNMNKKSKKNMTEEEKEIYEKRKKEFLDKSLKILQKIKNVEENEKKVENENENGKENENEKEKEKEKEQENGKEKEDENENENGKENENENENENQIGNEDRTDQKDEKDEKEKSKIDEN